MPDNIADYTFIDDKIHVKILGYVNDDRVIDAFEFFDLNKNYEKLFTNAAFARSTEIS